MSLKHSVVFWFFYSLSVLLCFCSYLGIVSLTFWSVNSSLIHSIGVISETWPIDRGCQSSRVFLRSRIVVRWLVSELGSILSWDSMRVRRSLRLSGNYTLRVKSILGSGFIHIWHCGWHMSLSEFLWRRAINQRLWIFMSAFTRGSWLYCCLLLSFELQHFLKLDKLLLKSRVRVDYRSLSLDILSCRCITHASFLH